MRGRTWQSPISRARSGGKTARSAWSTSPSAAAGDMLVCNTYEGVCTAIARHGGARCARARRGGGARRRAVGPTTVGGRRSTTSRTFLARPRRRGRRDRGDASDGGQPRVGCRAHEALRARQRRRGRSRELRDLLVQRGSAHRAPRTRRATARSARSARSCSSRQARACSRTATRARSPPRTSAPRSASIFAAHEQGKIEHVWVDETRPVLQGARLTAWELMLAGVPCALITDNMAASVMTARLVDAVIVGADRIAANGDVANKIGTYGLAVLAHGARHPVLRGGADLHGRPHARERRRHRHRGARPARGHRRDGLRHRSRPDSPEESRALDMLTEDGPYYARRSTKGHELVVSRKGGAYQFDGWLRIAPPDVRGLQPRVRRHARGVRHRDHHRARRRARPTSASRWPRRAAGSGAIHEL